MPTIISKGVISAQGFGFSYSKPASASGTVGIFALAYICVASVTRNKYTFTTDVNGSATNASVASYAGTAAGNSTRGIFALGYASSPSTTRDKYTYATDANGSATASSCASAQGASTGNSTRGI